MTKVYLKRNSDGVLETPLTLMTDGLARRMAAARKTPVTPAIVAEAQEQVAKQNPDLATQHFRLSNAAAGRFADLTPEEKFAVDVLARVDAFAEPSPADFGSTARSIAKQIISGASGFSANDFDLLSQAVEFSKGKQSDPQNAMPGGALVAAGIVAS